MPIIKHVLKTTYVVTKNVLSGALLTLTCFNGVKQCLKNVSNEDLSSITCKLALASCSPIYATVFIGAFSSKKQFSKFKTVGKILIKGVSLIYSGPRKGLDIITEPLEILIFGEPVPIQAGNLFFIN